MAAKTNKKEGVDLASTVARSDDGTIQITYAIPLSLIKKTEDEVLEKLQKDTEISGFRKGMAPIEKVKDSLSYESLVEKILAKILPMALSHSIETHKLKLVTYPKFELLSVNKDNDWQIRATTCELPDINLRTYKDTLINELKVKSIWTPEKSKSAKEKPEKSQAEKEQEVIKLLLKTVEIKIPKILIDEEVNTRLSQLLEKIEKLGLNLDAYLSSIGKSADNLRSEYTQQAKDSISLELILNRIALEEKINIEQKEIDDAVKASTVADKSLEEKLKSPEQQRLIKSILLRRKALDNILALV